MSDEKDDKKVVDLHPDRPTPKRVLESFLESVDTIENVIVLVQDKNGDVGYGRSEMTVAEACLLNKFLDTQLSEEILDAMEGDE